MFNLTNCVYYEDNSSFTLNSSNPDPENADFGFYDKDHLLIDFVNKTIDIAINLSLVSSTTKLPFNISNNNNTDTSDLEISLSIVSTAKKLAITTVLDFSPSQSISWSFLIGAILACLAAMASVCYGGFKVELTGLDHYARAAQGHVSAVILAVVYFQYFGIFVMFLLIVDSSYFIFYVVASICLVVMACQCYKIAFIFYLEKHLDNPNLRAPGLRSPRGKFVALTLIFLVANYLVSSLMIRYTAYSYYIIGLSTFPIINVIENGLRGIKKCFSR